MRIEDAHAGFRFLFPAPYFHDDALKSLLPCVVTAAWRWDGNSDQDGVEAEWNGETVMEGMEMAQNDGIGMKIYGQTPQTRPNESTYIGSLLLDDAKCDEIGSPGESEWRPR